MDAWSDIEVISIDGEGGSDAGDKDDTDEEIFSQELQDKEDEEDEVEQEDTEKEEGEATIGDIRRRHQRDSLEEDASIGATRKQDQHKGRGRRGKHDTPRFSITPGDSSTASAIDLTADEPGAARAGPPSAPIVLSFQEEYDELLAGMEGDGAVFGAWFPFEAVAELLLRYPEHWWCRWARFRSMKLELKLAAK